MDRSNTLSHNAEFHQALQRHNFEEAATIGERWYREGYILGDSPELYVRSTKNWKGLKQRAKHQPFSCALQFLFYVTDQSLRARLLRLLALTNGMSQRTILAAEIAFCRHIGCHPLITEVLKYDNGRFLTMIDWSPVYLRDAYGFHTRWSSPELYHGPPKFVISALRSFKPHVSATVFEWLISVVPIEALSTGNHVISAIEACMGLRLSTMLPLLLTRLIESEHSRQQIQNWLDTFWTRQSEGWQLLWKSDWDSVMEKWVTFQTKIHPNTIACSIHSNFLLDLACLVRDYCW